MRQISFLLFLLLTLSALVGAEYQATPVVSVSQQKSDSGLTIKAVNNQGAPITITLVVDKQSNMDFSPSPPVTVTLAGHQARNLMTASRSQPGRAWSMHYTYHWVWGDLQAHHDPSQVYRLPYASGKRFRVIQGYDGQFSHQHQKALDFSLPEGTPVLAARAGQVVSVQSQYRTGGTDPSFKNRVNFVMVLHDDRTLAEYDHLRFDGVVVSPGQQVQAGDLLGYSGATGYASGPHLHFWVFGAENGSDRRSYATRFETTEGVVELVEGESYTAP